MSGILLTPEAKMDDVKSTPDIPWTLHRPRDETFRSWGKVFKITLLPLALYFCTILSTFSQPSQTNSTLRERQRSLTFQQLLKYDALNANQTDWITHLLGEQHEMIGLFQKYSFYSNDQLANRIETIFEVTEAKIFSVLDSDQQDMWRHQQWLVERIPEPRAKPSKLRPEQTFPAL